MRLYLPLSKVLKHLLCMQPISIFIINKTAVCSYLLLSVTNCSIRRVPGAHEERRQEGELGGGVTEPRGPDFFSQCPAHCRQEKPNASWLWGVGNRQFMSLRSPGAASGCRVCPATQPVPLSQAPSVRVSGLLSGQLTTASTSLSGFTVPMEQRPFLQGPLTRKT